MMSSFSILLMICLLFFQVVSLGFILILHRKRRLQNQKNQSISNELRGVKEQYRNFQKYINEEFQLARKIQESLLPQKLPSSEPIRIYTNYSPAEELGGDLFDAIQIDENHLGLLVADISGHSLSSSFFATMAKMSFNHNLPCYYSPKRALESVNKELKQYLITDHYLTAFYGILNTTNNIFRYTKASHPPALLFRAGTGEILELKTKGLFVGLFEDGEYQEASMQLQTGDKLLLYTDGLYENFNPENKIYGRHRLKNFFQSLVQEKSESILPHLQAEINKFLGKKAQQDDITIMLVEILGNGQPRQNDIYEHIDSLESAEYSEFSNFNEMTRNILRILEQIKNYSWSEKVIKRLKVILFESFINAIKHGNNSDETKKIKVVYQLNSEKIIIAVQDEGEGFDFKNLPDPSRPENISKSHGRGLFIIRNYCTDVKFNRSGSCITMIIENDPIAERAKDD